MVARWAMTAAQKTAISVAPATGCEGWLSATKQAEQAGEQAHRREDDERGERRGVDLATGLVRH
jgi:hypothetical protein